MSTTDKIVRMLAEQLGQCAYLDRFPARARSDWNRGRLYQARSALRPLYNAGTPGDRRVIRGWIKTAFRRLAGAYRTQN